MTRLSVNINKVATLRNARGGNNPNVVQVAQDCERFGAEGITVHPRPDERHITHADVFALKNVVTTEFNIEGFPDSRFLNLVMEVSPDQVTLVPDKPDAITSDHGWDVENDADFLLPIITKLKSEQIRVSLFVDPILSIIEGAAKLGVDRIELYTEPYATTFLKDSEKSIFRYINAANKAAELGLGVNAGHDLNLDNLSYFYRHIPNLKEVSIGHALICDALYLGLENTIQLYRRQLTNEAKL